MKKIIILGATGHIGAYTTDWLRNTLDISKYEIIPCGKRDVKYYTENGYNYIKLDICNLEDFMKLPTDDVYAVVDFASIMPAAMKGYDPYKYVDINIRGTLNVLEYCKNVKCQKIIIPTTEADLSGYWEDGATIQPNLPPKYDYSSNYAMYILSRLTVLDMLKIYQAKYGLIPFALRCSTIYCYTESPYMFKNGKRIIPGYIQIYQKAINGEDIEIWGNPNVKTDIVYVKDFAQIVEKAIISKTANGGIYNVGTGMPVTLYDQVKIAIEVLGSTPPHHRKKIKYNFCSRQNQRKKFCTRYYENM